MPSSSTTIAIDGSNHSITMSGLGQFPIAAGPLFLDFAACENFGVSLLGSGVLDLIFEDGFE